MKNFSDFRNCISRLTSRRGLAFACGFALLLLLLPAGLHGQAVSRINGDVTDQAGAEVPDAKVRSEEHTSELQSQSNLVCRLLLEKKNLNFSFRNSSFSY